MRRGCTFKGNIAKLFTAAGNHVIGEGPDVEISKSLGISCGQRSRAGPDRALSSSRAAAQAEPALAEEEAGAAGPGEQIASTPHRSISVLNRYRALLLDSTYRPVGVANWQR